MSDRVIMGRPVEDSKVIYIEGRGVMFRSWRTSVQMPKKDTIGGKRGIIKGWSRASRRRMRKTLLFYAPLKGQTVFGATFTIPGPVMPARENRYLWKTFCQRVAWRKFGMIWRCEVQARGALHWHTICTCPAGENPDDLERLWFACLDDLGEVEMPAYVGTVNGQKIKVASNPFPGGGRCKLRGLRSGLPGADRHAVDLDMGGGALRGAWLRYLQDHATKSKQEQIGENIGRHWGVVGRKWWQDLYTASKTGEGTDIDTLTDRQWAYVLRCVQRLATPSRANDKAPFGRSLGYRVRRGGRGESVWFSNVATIRRIVKQAVKEYPDSFEGGAL